MTRVLFIRYKKSNSILDGGEQVAEMHHHALVQLFEKDCVDTYYLHSQDKKRSVLDYLRGVRKLCDDTIDKMARACVRITN